MELILNLERSTLQTSIDFGTFTEVFAIDPAPETRIEKNEIRKLSNDTKRLNLYDLSLLARGEVNILDTTTTTPSSSVATNTGDQVAMKDLQITKEENQTLLYEIRAMTRFLQTLEDITEELVDKGNSIYDELCKVEFILERTYKTLKLVENLYAFDARPKPILLTLEWKVFEFGNNILDKLAVLGDDIKDHLLTVNSLGMEFVNLAEEFALHPIESSLHIESERIGLNVKVREICRLSNRNLETFLNFQAIEYDHSVRYEDLENEIEKFDSMYILLMSLQSEEGTFK